jgi:hypothetical protein
MQKTGRKRLSYPHPNPLPKVERGGLIANGPCQSSLNTALKGRIGRRVENEIIPV